MLTSFLRWNLLSGRAERHSGQVRERGDTAAEQADAADSRRAHFGRRLQLISVFEGRGAPAATGLAT